VKAIWQSGGKLYLTYDTLVFDPVTFTVVEVVDPLTLYQIDSSTGQATVIGPTALSIVGVYDANGTDYAFDDLTRLHIELHGGRHA
jgi:hypothetical protein